MKSLFFLICLSAIVGVTPLLAQPKIDVVGGTSLEFGDSFSGQKVNRVVTIKNMGSDTLRISDVKAQCGCTAALMAAEDKTIPPRGAGKLSITFDTHNYSGRVSKQVYVSSNDTAHSRLTITFTTNVLNALDLDPKLLSFDNLKLDSTYTKTVTVTNPSPKNSLKILSVIANSPDLKVTLLKNELMPGEKTQLQAVYHASKTGQFQGVVELTTNHPTQPKLNISYYAWVNRK